MNSFEIFDETFIYGKIGEKCLMFKKRNKSDSNTSSGTPYIECVCGYKILIDDTCHGRGYARCHNCAMMINIGNAKLHVSGNNASEVMQAMQSGIEAIKQADIYSQPATSVSVSGGSVQINIPNDNAEVKSTQVIRNEVIEDGLCEQTDN